MLFNDFIDFILFGLKTKPKGRELTLIFTKSASHNPYISLFLTTQDNQCQSLFSVNLVSQLPDINTGNSASNPSARLDVKFSNKGFLSPQVTLTASNVAAPAASPVAGLLVYNTATTGTSTSTVVPGYYYWDGTKWSFMFMPTGITGQTLCNEGGDWIANRTIFNNGTNVGIGTGDITHKLTIAGTIETVRVIGPGIWGSEAKLYFGDANLFIFLKTVMINY